MLINTTLLIAGSPSENQILKFISYFRGPILYVMEIAVILSAGLRDWIDFGACLACFSFGPVCCIFEKRSF